MKNRVNCWNAKGVTGTPMPISSQAKGSVGSTLEGPETRTVSSASNKRSHERPALSIQNVNRVVMI